MTLIDHERSSDTASPFTNTARGAQRASEEADHEPRRVLLVAEATYPYHWGGVSTWCHSLVRELPDVQFTFRAIVSDPDASLLFDVPDRVELETIPLWGTRGLAESRRDLSLSRRSARISGTTRGVIEARFLPAFDTFVRSLFTDEVEPEQLAVAVHGMYRFFVDYDFDTTMLSSAVRDCFTTSAGEHFAAVAAAAGYDVGPISLFDAALALEILTRWIQPLALPIPEVDVAHAAMAGSSTLVTVAAQLEYGAGLMLTEHGIYLRERFLDEASATDSLFLKVFRLRFALRMTELSYAMADQISPCCDDHKRWERRVGAAGDKLQTIYYAADAEVFEPAASRDGTEAPVVVWLGRIDPLKDVQTLIHTAERVHRVRPDVRFRLFGSAPTGRESYLRQCMLLRERLDMESVVELAGFTDDPAAAFNEGDLVLLSSISEGFPYSTLEAMLCAKPIVATDVGGLKEQVGDCGRVVEPRNPDKAAEAILELLDDRVALAALGVRARARVIEEFSVEAYRDAHLGSYARLGMHPSSDRSLTPEIEAAFEPPPASDLETRRQVRHRRDLLRAIRSEVPSPVHPLELAAVIESMGVTDAGAAFYGAAGVFPLADHLYDVLLEERTGGGSDGGATEAGPTEPEQPRSRGWVTLLYSFVPAALFLFVLRYWSQADPDFTRTDLGGLTLGAAVGLIFANGYLQSLVPRASLHLGCHSWASYRRVLRPFTIAGVFALASLVGVITLGAVAVGAGDPSARWLFALSAAGIGLLWIVTAPATSSGDLFALPAATVAGFAVGATVDLVGIGFELAIAIGFGAALAVGLVGTAALIRSNHDGAWGDVPAPSRSFLWAESMPYVVYGVSFMGLMLGVYGVAWAYSFDSGLTRQAEIDGTLVAVNISMIPVLLSVLLAERSMRKLRTRQFDLRRTHPAQARTFAVSRLRRFLGIRLLMIAAQTAFLCGAIGAGVWRLLDHTDIGARVGIIDPQQAKNALVVSLCAAVFLSVANLASAFAFTMGRPDIAANAALTGLAVFGIGAAVTLLALPFALITAFICAGAVTFALAAHLYLRRAFLNDELSNV